MRCLLGLRTYATTSRVRIYTRTGDKGNSSLFNGERRRKDDVIFDCLGTADELNANVGLCVAELHGNPRHEQLRATLIEIQSRLMDVCSCVATPPAGDGCEGGG